VEEVQICGYRRIRLKTILSKVKTRPGDRFNQEQIQRDFEAALPLGFDPAKSKL
jgi:outer membrane protein assembly factor BamA